MKRSEVERVAEKMFAMWAPGADHDGYIGEGWERLARWHLREVRRARGKTIMRVSVNPVTKWLGDPGEFCNEARVVLVPRRRPK